MLQFWVSYYLILSLMIGLAAGMAALVGRAWAASVKRRLTDNEATTGTTGMRFDAEMTEEWLVYCRRLAVELAEMNGTVTVDDIWAVSPGDAPIDGRKIGLVFKSDGWERVGTKRSTRGRNQTREIGVWRRAPQQIDIEDAIRAKGAA